MKSSLGWIAAPWLARRRDDPVTPPAMATLRLSDGETTSEYRTHRGRLFSKCFLLILTLVTSAILASGVINIYFTYQENRSALLTLNHEKAFAAASLIEQYIRQIEQQLKYAALPQLDANDVELRRLEFLKLLRQAPEVTDISELDGQGHEQVAVSRLGMDNINSGKDRSQEPAFVNARPRQTWFGPVYFRNGKPYMTIAIPSGGDKRPLIVAEVNLSFVWDFVSHIKIGKNGKAYVVDGNGSLIAPRDIGLYIPTLPPQRVTEPTMLSRDLAGTEVLTAVVPIELLGWNVFVEQPVAVVYEKLNASIARTGILLLAGLVISALAALALTRSMVRPIPRCDKAPSGSAPAELDQRNPQ